MLGQQNRGKPDPTFQMPSGYAQMSEKPKHLPSLSSMSTDCTHSGGSPCLSLPGAPPSGYITVVVYSSVAVIKLTAEAACRRKALSWPMVPEGESAMAEESMTAGIQCRAERSQLRPRPGSRESKLEAGRGP